MPYEYTSTYFDDPFVPGRVMDVMVPAKVTQDVALFFIHGGGWTGGGREGYNVLINAFMKKGFICGNTDYRLQGVKIQDKITDCRHGYDLFISFLKKQKRPLKVAVHGGSAGAHLAMMLTLAKPGACGDPITFQEFKPANEWVKPVGTFVQATPATFEPWEDIFPHQWTAMKNLVGVSYEEHPEAYRVLSPIEYVEKGTPAIFFQEAEDEHVFPKSENEKLMAKAHKLGVRAEMKVYPRCEHGFFYELTRWQQREAFDDIVKFVESLG